MLKKWQTCKIETEFDCMKQKFPALDTRNNKLI